MFVKPAGDDKSDKGSDGDSGRNIQNDSNASSGNTKQANKGTVIIDATCAPADIAYPTDLAMSLTLQNGHENHSQLRHSFLTIQYAVQPAK